MIFVSSDLHVGRSMNKGIHELFIDSFTALNKLRKVILDYDTTEDKHVILAGDIYDLSKIEGSTMKAVNDFVTELTAHNISVYFIEGNHDRKDPNNPHSYPLLLANASEEARLKVVHIGDGKTRIIDGRKVIGFDYAPPEKIKERLKGITDCDILVLHQAFEEMLPFEGSFDLSFDDIPLNVNHVIAGDIHVPALKARQSGKYFLSPGSLHACAIDQTSDHFVWLLGKGSMSWKNIRLDPPRHVFYLEIIDEMSLDAQYESQLQDLIDECKKHNTKPILAIYYKRSKADLLDRAREVLSTRFLIIEYPSSSGKVLNTESIAQSITQYEKLTMGQALPYVCNPEKNKDVYCLLEGLLSGEDTGRALDKFVQEQLYS